MAEASGAGVPTTTTVTATETTPTVTKQKELDLVFICDSTGSMSEYLAAAQQNIQKIVEEIVSAEKCSVRFALVEYKDHSDTQTVLQSPFTTSVSDMRKFVDRMTADGGGDTPEAVADGLKAALDMDWRVDAAKVVCLIADAPPHGLGDANCDDSYPDQCPCKEDPIQLAKAMAKKGIVVYTIGAEPGLSSSSCLARDFMRAVAKITTGLFLPLGSANLLAKVIVGSAVEQLQLKELLTTVAGEVKKLKEEKGKEFTKEDATKYMETRMKEMNVETDQVKVDDIYQGGLEALPGAWFQYSKVADIRHALLGNVHFNRSAADGYGSGFSFRSSSSSSSYGGGIFSRVKAAFTGKKTAAAPSYACESDAAPVMMMSGPPSSTVISADMLSAQSATFSKSSISCEQVSRMYEQGENMGLY